MADASEQKDDGGLVTATVKQYFVRSGRLQDSIMLYKRDRSAGALAPNATELLDMFADDIGDSLPMIDVDQYPPPHVGRKNISTYLLKPAPDPEVHHSAICLIDKDKVIVPITIYRTPTVLTFVLDEKRKILAITGRKAVSL